jgi:hypothetical protein
VTGGLVQNLQTKQGWGTGRRLPSRLLTYAIMGLLNFGLSLILSTKSEARKDTCTDSLPANDERHPLLSENTVDAHEADTKPYEQLSFLKPLLPTPSKESRSLIFKLCLFAIDSIAPGLTPSSWMTYFNRKFGIKEGSLGSLFFATNILSSASNLFASSIACRIGLIKIMVFTHVPASIALALALIPLPNNLILLWHC